MKLSCLLGVHKFILATTVKTFKDQQKDKLPISVTLVMCCKFCGKIKKEEI